jgi:hypothetical protein
VLHALPATGGEAVVELPVPAGDGPVFVRVYGIDGAGTRVIAASATTVL